MSTDESSIGIWLGLICFVTPLLMWIPCDLWLKRHHHELITTEMREALQSGGWWALAICGVIGAVLFIAAYHFFYQRSI